MSHEHSHDGDGAACRHGSTTAAQTLDEMDFEKGIWSAALYNDMDRLRKLLDRNKDQQDAVDSRDSAGYTALHYAARNGHSRICRELLDRGAFVDARTRAGRATALHRAVTAGHSDTVRLLLSRRADGSLCDADGHNAVHRAILADRRDVLESLLEARPDLKSAPNAKTGREPRQLTESDELLRLL